VRLLLDTLTVLWWQEDSAQLGAAARRTIAAAEVVFVSAASAWELVMKGALGRVRLPVPFAMVIEDSGFTELPISLAHVAALSALPPHHADPIDRMLIAQALSEQLTLVSHNRQFAPYGVSIVWA
jgi:PIN domain nuclease of toxin-antitoxin system